MSKNNNNQDQEIDPALFQSLDLEPEPELTHEEYISEKFSILNNTLKSIKDLEEFDKDASKKLIINSIDSLIKDKFNLVDIKNKLLNEEDPYKSIREILGENAIRDVVGHFNTQILQKGSPSEKGVLLAEYLSNKDEQKAIECLKAGAAVNIKHEETGLTPLDIATRLGHDFFDLAVTLVNKGAEIHPNNVRFFIANDERILDQGVLTKLLLASGDEEQRKTLEGMRAANGMKFTETSDVYKTLMGKSTEDLARKFAAHTPNKNAKSGNGFDVDLILDNCPLALIKKLDEIDKKLSTKTKPTLYESVTNAISTVINYIVSPFIGKDQDMQKVLTEFNAVSKERAKEQQPSKRLNKIEEILAKGENKKDQSFAEQLTENRSSQVRDI